MSHVLSSGLTALEELAIEDASEAYGQRYLDELYGTDDIPPHPGREQSDATEIDLDQSGYYRGAHDDKLDEYFDELDQHSTADEESEADMPTGLPQWLLTLLIREGYGWLAEQAGTSSTAGDALADGSQTSTVSQYRSRSRRRRRRRLLTCSDKSDIAFLHGQLGGGQLGRAAISALLSRRCG